MTRALFLLLLLCVTLLAATPRSDYQARVREAAQLAQNPQAETAEHLLKLLPASEDVSDQAETIHVSNAWLHAQIATLSTNDETRAREWKDIAAYLNALNQRVSDPSATVTADFKLERAKLESILARPEYQAETKESSAIQQWLKKLRERLWDFFRRFFSPADIATPSQGTVSIARVIIITLLAIALLVALYQLAQWWRRSAPRKKAKDDSREILGVELTEETTTEDLLATARALAQQGDYRGAIRRAYLALLFELEQRGKLRLHRSKSNRDYVNALRNEAELYAAFVRLTLNFERVWYGQTLATNNDFEGFLSVYQQALQPKASN